MFHYPTESQFQEVLKSIQKQPWYVNNAKFHSYLESEWLTCILVSAEYHVQSRHLYTYIYIHTVVGSCISAGVSLWCGHQQHNRSFNNVLQRRYLSLRQDTTIFSLVQTLVEVVFPQQEVWYMQATIKQTNAYRRPRYHLPNYLNNISHTAQSICLLNMERGKAIPKSHVTQQEPIGLYSLLSSSSA